MVVANPAAAIAAGIGMVHQHFKLVPSLTVAENVFLGIEIRKAGLIDHAAQIERTAALSKQFGLQVDPAERVGLLSVGIEQRIEILKVLVRGARVIILDEPTAVLTPQESRELFQTLRGFVAQGMTVLFISHHLEEVMEVSDTVTVLRHGREVATRRTAGLAKLELVQMMVGRIVNFDRRPRQACSGKTVLEVRDLWARDERRLPAVRGVSFDVRAGEIVGIAGVAGNGQTELAEVIAGPAAGKPWHDHARRPIAGRPFGARNPGRRCRPCAGRSTGPWRRSPGDHRLEYSDGTAGQTALVALRRHRPAPISRSRRRR